VTDPETDPVIGNLSVEALAQLACPTEHRLVFINGCYHSAWSNLGALPEGVILSSFAQALDDHPELIAALLGQIANAEEQAFTALNTALMSDGVFLMLAPEVIIDAPIHCLFITTATVPPLVSHIRLLVLLQENSQLSLIEHYIGAEQLGLTTAQPKAADHTGCDNLSNVVTEIRLQPGAQLSHCKLQQESVNSSHISAMYVEQQRASSFISHSYSLGAALARHDIQIKLLESQAECSLNGAYLVDGRQHVDYHTSIEHIAAGCNSRQIYKGVVQGRARAVFNGKVVIQPLAQQSNARQLNKNLLLGDKAEVDTKPELQIYADDVSCSHGATVGQLDLQSLFYLQSRGISKQDAQRWLVFGFVSEILEQLDDLALRQFIQRPVVRHLNRLVGNHATAWDDELEAAGVMSCH
jgi:Fe-S cluster assembly protein SufD